MEEAQAQFKKPEPGATCPCGSGRSFGDCCDAILTGKRLADTAEQLMRARFSAHVVHDFEFLHRSCLETARQPFTGLPVTPATVWTKLVIHAHEPDRNAEKAHVDFSAYGVEGGTEQVLHEKAEFSRKGGAWIYVRAVREGPAPFKAAAPKPGRNELCPCGSGKKYKHCCLLKT